MTGIRAFYHFLHRQEKDSIVILFADINNIKTPEQKKKKKKYQEKHRCSNKRRHCLINVSKY